MRDVLSSIRREKTRYSHVACMSIWGLQRVWPQNEASILMHRHRQADLRLSFSLQVQQAEFLLSTMRRLYEICGFLYSSLVSNDPRYLDSLSHADPVVYGPDCSCRSSFGCFFNFTSWVSVVVCAWLFFVPNKRRYLFMSQQRHLIFHRSDFQRIVLPLQGSVDFGFCSGETEV